MSLRNTFTTGVIIATLSTPALANPVQVNNHGSPAQAQVYGDGSAAAAQRQQQNQHQTQTATGGSATATGGNGRAQSYSGGGQGGSVSGSAIGITVPNIGGMASCGGGFSLGGIVPSGGASGGGMWEFGECKTEREARTLYEMGQPAAAIALMCSIDRVRDAYRRIGVPCDAPLPPEPVFVAPPPRPLGYQGPCNLPDVIWADGSCHPHVVHVAVKLKPKVECHDEVKIVRECREVR